MLRFLLRAFPWAYTQGAENLTPTTFPVYLVTPTKDDEKAEI